MFLFYLSMFFLKVYNFTYYFIIITFKSLTEDMSINFRERGRERDIDWFPPVRALTEDQTCNLGRYVPRPGIKSATFWFNEAIWPGPNMYFYSLTE